MNMQRWISVTFREDLKLLESMTNPQDHAELVDLAKKIQRTRESFRGTPSALNDLQEEYRTKRALAVSRARRPGPSR